MDPWTVVGVFILVGIVLWLNNVDVPRGTRVKMAINIFVVLIFVLWLLFRVFGLALPVTAA